MKAFIAVLLDLLSSIWEFNIPVKSFYQKYTKQKCILTMQPCSKEWKISM